MKRAAPAAAVFVLAACGSTVTVGLRTQPSSGSDGLGASNSAVSEPGGSPTQGATAFAGGLSGGGAGNANSTQPGQGAGANRAFGAGSSLAATAPITIGLSYPSSYGPADSMAAAFGAQGYTTGNQKQIYDALVHYFNTHGGLAGHQLRPIYHVSDTTSDQTTDELDQATCQDLTEDHHVFAALDAGLGTDTYYRCMSARGVLMIQNGQNSEAAKTYDKYPLLFSVAGLNYDQMAKSYITSLVAQHFLTAGNRIGFLLESCQVWKDVATDSLLPTLSSFGLKPYDTYEQTCADSDANTAAAVRDAQAVVVRFNTDHVDRVIWLHDSGAVEGIAFMNQAESQHYHPRYGLNSMDTPQAGLVALGAVPKDQLSGSAGMGWWPDFDVSSDVTTYATKAAHRCFAILNSEGALDTSSQNAGLQELEDCETFFFLEAVVKGETHVSVNGVRAAAARLGDAFNSTLTIDGLTDFGQQKHDGVSVYRPFAYRDGCGCFAYTGPPTRT